MKNRQLFWDNFKGILIILVVFGHFISNYATNLPDSLAAKIYVFIYSFHMPAFIFCSGYFSKSERSRSAVSLAKFLLCYFVFNTLMLLFTHFYLGSAIRLMTPYLSYWYLISLITWRLLIGKLHSVKGLFPISVLIALALGYNKDITELLALRRTLAFFPFFIAGYQLDTRKFNDFLQRRKPWHMAAGWVLCLAASAAAFWAVNRFGVTPNSTLMFSYNAEAGLLQRILIFAVSFLAISCMLLAIPDRSIPFLSRIGKHSLLIYLVHRFVTIIYYMEWVPFQTYTRLHLVYALAATCILCCLLSGDRLNRAFSSGCDFCACFCLVRSAASNDPYIPPP